MNLAKLLEDVTGQLPEDRRKALEGLVAEFSAGEDFRFLLALVAGANKRQRQVVRLFLNDLEKLDIQAESSSRS